jgi:hypothetical protein
MKKNLIWIAVIVIVALGVGYGGVLYGESSASKNSSTNQQGRGQFGQGGPAGMRRNGGGANGGGFVNGEILSKDANSLTIKLSNGGSKIVFLSDKTTINKMATGTPADLEIGKNVMITGNSDNDGNVTAESIQLRPAFNPGNGQNPGGAPTTDKITK